MRMINVLTQSSVDYSSQKVSINAEQIVSLVDVSYQHEKIPVLYKKTFTLQHYKGSLFSKDTWTTNQYEVVSEAVIETVACTRINLNNGNCYIVDISIDELTRMIAECPNL